MAGALNDWKKAKNEYEKLTGQKKPSEKFWKNFRKSSGIESALKECDKKVSSWDEERLEQGKQALEKLKEAVDEYMKLLDNAINVEKEKEVKTTLYRGLKMLKTRLEKYVAAFAGDLASAEASVAKGRDRLEKLSARAKKDVASAYAKIRAASNRVKAKPEVDVYNKEMIYADNMRRALHYVEQARAAGDLSLKNPSHFQEAIYPYHMYKAGKGKMKPGTEPSTLLAEMKRFSMIAKLIYKEYK